MTCNKGIYGYSIYGNGGCYKYEAKKKITKYILGTQPDSYKWLYNKVYCYKCNTREEKSGIKKFPKDILYMLFISTGNKITYTCSCTIEYRL